MFIFNELRLFVYITRALSIEKYGILNGNLSEGIVKGCEQQFKNHEKCGLERQSERELQK
jgi:hypothetical protein